MSCLEALILFLGGSFSFCLYKQQYLAIISFYIVMMQNTEPENKFA